jgi:tetratricopeptide (TPR) repeat protein
MQGLEEPVGLARSLEMLVKIALRQGRLAVARPLLEELLALCRQAGDADRLIHALEQWGHLARDEGDFPQAQAAYQESLRLCCEWDYPYPLAQMLEDLAALATREGQHQLPAERAGTRPRFAHALPPERSGGRGTRPEGTRLGVGGARRALRLLGAAEAFCETLGLRPPVGEPEEYMQTVTAGRAALGEAAFAAAWTEGRSMSLEEALAFALSLE